MARKGVDKLTREWVRGPADQAAAAAGCRLDLERGQFVVDWIQKYCRLYEGERAGEPMILHDWQLDCTLRLFGWVTWSERWNRWIRRFRRASIWVPKKNKKSPTLAAWGLYLLCGDGEPGQKIYLAAKDGNQAREISGKHAIEMLTQSAALMSECTINKSSLQITHDPSRSIMKPLSSSNSKTQQAKEGLNGSVLIDETHVVDREFIDRISRAGISRSEPLQLEVSTAGNNPDSYGKSQFDRAVQVEAGTITDQGLFVAIHAAPQDLDAATLDEDPLKYGTLANPAMGHTVYPEEFLDDYARSKVSMSDLASFCMYRLNIWQKTSNPFLKAGDWDACREEFTEEDLVGQTCVAGLDLSQTQDMTALALIFPGDDGESVRVLPYFWLPEDTAKELNHLVPFLQWADEGWLELTPGSVVDYGYVRSRFRDLAQKFIIQRLGYDRTYAEETTQNLAEGVMDANGNVIEEGTGIERIIVPQTILSLAGPTARFERLVIAGILHHNGHPILTWQAGHVQVWKDRNNNKRPVKPSSHDVKKIDGIIAIVNGLAVMSSESDTGPSVYETRGVVRIG